MSLVRELIKCPDKIRANIINVFEQANEKELEEGLSWYQSAKSFSIQLAKENNISEIKTAGVIAVTSPRKYWEDNKKIAKDYFKGKYRHTQVQITKAHNICSSSSYVQIVHHIAGIKTVNFFHNIMFPEDRNFVTIDRHQMQLSLGIPIDDITERQYNEIKRAHLCTAKFLNVHPVTLQATTWICYKRLKTEKQNLYF